MSKKLAIITTHPIQYNAPLFAMLKTRGKIEIKIFYTWGEQVIQNKYDPGFKRHIQWDIPLLEGYEYSFVKNVASSPGSHHYKGIQNPSLINELQQWGANAVLLFGWNFKSHLAAIRFFKNKIPVFFRGDSTLLDEKKGLKQVIRKLVLRYVYSHIDIAFYAGAANKAYFKAMGLKEEQLVFMPHAIDNSRFAANEVNVAAGRKLRAELNIPADAVVFLFAGKLEEKKQPNFLIESFLSMKYTKAFLIVAGSGELEKTLTDTYSAYSSIKFIGFQNQNQMPSVYNCCDVFVLPSKGPGETWGLCINEAMAASKAIIASEKCGACYDLIQQKNNGFVIQSDDVQDLKSALIYFEKNKKEAVIFGKASYEIIQQHTFHRDCEAIESTVHFTWKLSKNED